MNFENSPAKQLSELSFWVSRYVARGERPFLGSEAVDRYCFHLGIQRDTFAGRLVADIGCGPVGSLDQFEARLKFGVDVLARSYSPLGIQAHDMIYLAAPVENLPFTDDFLDDVISWNALDHVDDFEAAIQEIHRVLKPDGRVFLAFNLDHTPTVQEPQYLTRPRIAQALAGLFEIRSDTMSTVAEAWQSSAPGGVYVVQASKITKPSRYQEQVSALIQRLKTDGVTLEALDLEYIAAHGSSPAIAAERAAANAFVEYRQRQKGWENRLLRASRLAVAKNPRLLLNRGLLAISWRAWVSLLGFGSPRPRHP